LCKLNWTWIHILSTFLLWTKHFQWLIYGCAFFSTMIWDSWDEVAPSSRITKPIGELEKFPVAVRFSIGYSSHQLLQCPPSPRIDQWVCVKNVFLELCCLLQLKFLVVSWQHLHLP
jgi:hypothetical protein